MLAAKLRNRRVEGRARILLSLIGLASATTHAQGTEKRVSMNP